MSGTDAAAGGGFELHPRLAADTYPIKDLALSRVLFMNDSRYPWVILVPKRPNIVEIHDLAEADRLQLMTEISAASEALTSLFETDKINVGALGNIVPQLHVHVLSRRQSDAAWPGPVWGVGEAIPHGEEERVQMIRKIAAALSA